MTDHLDVELEVVTLTGGPADGQKIEAPIGYLEIWHCHEGIYCRHERALPDNAEMRWTGQALDGPEAMVAWLFENGYVDEETGPLMHVTPDDPSPGVKRFYRSE